MLILIGIILAIMIGIGVLAFIAIKIILIVMLVIVAGTYYFTFILLEPQMATSSPPVVVLTTFIVGTAALAVMGWMLGVVKSDEG